MFYAGATFLSGYFVYFLKNIFQIITFCIFCAIMKIQKDHRRELGSSLPNYGRRWYYEKVSNCIFIDTNLYAYHSIYRLTV